MLAKPEDNLFIVGDDDQSIYRFRGAKPEIMLGFERDYPGAGRILLDVNYRSTEEIVAPALRLIGENQKRFSKAIHTTGRHGKNVITKLWQDPGKKIWPLPGRYSCICSRECGRGISQFYTGPMLVLVF